MNNQPQTRGGFFTIAVWQRADDLTVKIYQTTQTFLPQECYGLISQMQRSSVSVAANIAEGSGRRTLADYIRFLFIAKGSLTEVEYYIHLAQRLGYLSSESHTELNCLQRMTVGVLNGFIKFKENQRQHQS